MKIQFAATIKDRNGEALKEVDEAKSTVGKPPVMKVVTLGALVCAVLDTVFQDEANEGLKPKLRRAELVDKISEAEASVTPFELLDADREMIKERIGKRNYPPTLTAQAVRLLETPVSKKAA